MIVEVLCPDGRSTPEWLILELQGKLLPAPCLGAGALDGHLLGRLDPSPSGDPNRVLLNVGTYRVSGSLVVLKKPLLVLHRRGGGAGAAVSDDAAAAASARDVEMPAADAQDPCFIVRAVVRRKVLCDERPQPVVGSAAVV